jgi:glycosyltransferase involved in cell wall biosynthesis
MLQPRIGGGFTFQDDLISEISKENRIHEIYIISRHKGAHAISGARYINLANYREALVIRLIKRAINIVSRIFSGKVLLQADALDRAVKENGLELIWFLPTGVGRVTVPYIATVWDLAHRVHPYFPEVSVTGWRWEDRENRYRTLLLRAACIVTGTGAGKEEIIKYYQVPDHLVKVVPFPIPSFFLHRAKDLLVPANKVSQIQGRYLFYPAQFWPHKNHVGLLLALKIMREKYGMDLKLVLTGSDLGNLEYVRGKIRELNMDDQVTILGFVDKDVLVDLYKNAFALVFPTFFGPDNLPPLEAFAMGCPVIASAVSGAQEQLGDAAILFDPKDPEEIALKVKILYDDPTKREEMIRKGRLKAESLTIHSYVSQVLSFVDEFAPIRRCWSSDKTYICPK